MAFFTSSWISDFVISCILIFSSVYLFYRKKFKYWKKYNIPHTTPKFPFGDMGLNLLSEGTYGVSTRIYNSFKSEKIVGMWFLHSPMLLIRDLDLIRDILAKDFMNFHDRGFYLSEKNDPLMGLFLFFQNGEKWKFLRTKLTPTFTRNKMKMMFPVLIKCGNTLVEVLDKLAENGEIIEIKEYSARFGTDVIASSAFGIEANSLKNPEADFRKMGRMFLKPSVSLLISAAVISNRQLAEFFKIRLTHPTITKFFTNVVRETIDYRKANNLKKNDFMQLLMQLMDGEEIDDVDDAQKAENSENKFVRKLTFEEVAAQAFAFFSGGFVATSSVTEFALYELALNPDLQKQLREEIESIIEKYNKEITFEGIYEMKLLGRVIDETLRKYPHVTSLRRQCNKDFKVDGTDLFIPENTTVEIPVYAIHHDPAYYPNPEVFDPDRFKEEVKSKRHPYAYLPFGNGPRNCIGMRFALMQIRVGLATFLYHYKFEICEKTPIPMVFDPKGGGLIAKNPIYLRILKL